MCPSRARKALSFSVCGLVNEANTLLHARFFGESTPFWAVSARPDGAAGLSRRPAAGALQGVDVEFGPAARTLIEGAAAAEAAVDAEEAVVLLKHVALGGQLAELAPPARRHDARELVAAVQAAARERFLAWIAEHGAPASEVRVALGAFESCGARETAGAARRIRPGASGPETGLIFFLDVAARDPIFAEDLVVRDIGWALAKAAFAAAAERAAALKDLGVRLPR
jgi:hypothetical protein